MSRKGFTLIELAIAITLLALISAAVGSMYAVAFRNYQSQSQRQHFQKNINFTIDEINRDIKQAVSVPPTYDTFTNDPTHIILALPATDSSGNFIFNAGVLQKDYVVYYLSNGSVIKKTYAQPGSQRYAQNGSSKTLLSDVSGFVASFTPGGVPRQVTLGLTLSKVVSKRNISVSATTTADLRNSE